MTPDPNGKLTPVAKTLFSILFTMVLGLGGWTIKQGYDMHELKSDHLSGRRIEKHLWVIEMKLGVDPKKVDEFSPPAMTPTEQFDLDPVKPARR